jgi:hypothetical protein
MSDKALPQRKLPRKRLQFNTSKQPTKMNDPVSRPGDRDVEASRIIADPGIVDAQEKRPRLAH